MILHREGDFERKPNVCVCGFGFYEITRKDIIFDKSVVVW